MPTVSVITPCYNSEKYVGDTIESVARQTLADLEHIVVNDGSTDNSKSVIESYLDADPRLHLVSQKNSGVCTARNNGFRNCSPDSKYLFFLDADDCIEKDMLEVLSQYLDDHLQVGLVHCGHSYIDDTGQPISEAVAAINWRGRYVPTRFGIRALRPDEPETPFCSIYTLAGLVPSISFLRKSVFEAVGGFDESFGQPYEETDLFLRMALISEVHYLPQKLVRYRRHPSQITEQPEKFVVQERKLYNKWQDLSPFTANQKKVVLHAKWFHFHRLQAIGGIGESLKYLRQFNIPMSIRCMMGAVRRYRLINKELNVR